MHCSNCKTECSPDQNFCHKCGTEVEKGYCVSCGQEHKEKATTRHPIDQVVIRSVGYLLIIIIIFGAVRTNVDLASIKDQKSEVSSTFTSIMKSFLDNKHYLKLIKRNKYNFDSKTTYDVYLEGKFEKEEDILYKVNEWIKERDENKADVWIVNLTVMKDNEENQKIRFLRLDIINNPDKRVPNNFKPTGFANLFVNSDSL